VPLGQRPLGEVEIAALDLELTGLDPDHDAICEVAVVRGRGGAVRESWSSLVRPPVPVGEAARRVHGIPDAALAAAPPFAAVAERVRALLDGAVVVAHRVAHDLHFLRKAAGPDAAWLDDLVTVDTLRLSQRLMHFRNHRLSAVAGALGVPMAGAHRALADARTTFAVLPRLLALLDPDGALGADALAEELEARGPDGPRVSALRAVLERAHGRREILRIAYLSPGDGTLARVTRDIEIHALDGLTAVAWCHLRQDVRHFRLERILDAVPTGAPCRLPVPP
jgi:DNA polymerase III epsilon subunit-like protein